MPTNTKTNAEKAAIKRRQRSRRKRNELNEKQKVQSTDLLQAIIDDPSTDKKVRAVARITQRNSLGVAPKLNPTLASRILKYVMEGNYIKTACAACGITPITYYNWMKRAEAAVALGQEMYVRQLEADTEAAKKGAEAEKKRTEAREDDEDGDSLDEDSDKSVRDEHSPWDFIPISEHIYVHLSSSIAAAEAHGEMRLLRRAAAGEKGWQASMTILERRFSENWAKQETKRHIVEGDEDKPVVITYESDAERQRRVAAVLQRANVLEGEATEILTDGEMTREINEVSTLD
jgi:hypothetical protein